MTVQLIRMTAKEYAGAFYESSKRNPVFHKAYPNVRHYVEAFWPHFVDEARKNLSKMLSMNDHDVTPHMKKEIYEALVKDRERQVRGQAKYLRQRTVDA